jgi:hypothetical protein
MASNGHTLQKMMLGFIVRRCAATMGRAPSAEEFAHWANHYREGDRTVRLFGRPITVREAHAILRHPGREVSARVSTPSPSEAVSESHSSAALVSFAAAVAKLRNGRRKL